MEAKTAGRPERGRGAVRAVRTSLRTLHLLAFGALYGGHLYDVAPERLHGALAATVTSGVALAALDAIRAPVWLVQVRGLATLAKAGLLALVPVWWGGRMWLLTAAAIVGGVSSHMPGRLRYWSVLHGHAVGDGERG